MENNSDSTSDLNENNIKKHNFSRPNNYFRNNYRGDFGHYGQPANSGSSSRRNAEYNSIFHNERNFKTYNSRFIDNSIPNNSYAQPSNVENLSYFEENNRSIHLNHQELNRNINDTNYAHGSHYREQDPQRNHQYSNGKMNYHRNQTGFDRPNDRNYYINQQKANNLSFNQRRNPETNLVHKHKYNKPQKHETYGGNRNENRRHFNTKNKENFKEKNQLELPEMNQRDSLIWQLTHGKYECMICVANIRDEAATWSCDNCYHIFHVACIRKWATTCESAVNRDGVKMNLRCPACQKEFDVNSSSKELSLYHCFCGKVDKPEFKRGQVPHSCNEVCGKTNKTDERCRHLCSLLCHPGPCPSCEAMVTRNCHCGRSQITTKCNADERLLVCGANCDKFLNCGVHRCQSSCHAGECDSCEVLIGEHCWCDKQEERMSICGSENAGQEFSCGDRCGRVLACGNHRCESVCHAGDCDGCQLTPEVRGSCWCGKRSIIELVGHDRKSCLDPIPSCDQPCGKMMEKCDHPCMEKCHEGNCNPCPLSRDLPCRCGKSIQVGVQCATFESVRSVTCLKMCNKKLLCCRHRCAERCCDSELHLCLQTCGRLLECKSHHCERECGHFGACPSCPNVSFDELHCECGAATALPPIACGQPRPVCSEICSRDHDCEHTVRHNCHSEPNCPPCTELTSKYCPGKHKLLDNIPCFRPVATCGLPCDQPLTGCNHSCNRICHHGDCLTDNSVCTQPCTRTRNDCGHPCAAPCHPDDCELVLTSCLVQIRLSCSCKVRSISIQCFKLQSAISLLKFNNFNAKRENLEFIISPDGSASLPCDSECKKVARHVQLSDAFDIAITTSSLSTHYPDSFKAYAKRNIEFLIHIEKMFVDLAKNVKNISDTIHTHSIKNITEDKADFISRYGSCFKISCKCSLEQANKACVTIEVNRSKCCLPKPLLTDLLKIECPNLFPSKTDDEKNNLSSTASLTMSFADRIRLSKKE